MGGGDASTKRACAWVRVVPTKLWKIGKVWNERRREAEAMNGAGGAGGGGKGAGDANVNSRKGAMLPTKRVKRREGWGERDPRVAYCPRVLPLHAFCARGERVLRFTC